MTDDFTSNLLEAAQWFLIITPALAALFLVLLFLIVLLQVQLPEERVRGLFQRRSAPTRYAVGATLGAVTPFCSMTTIPVLAALLRGGVPFGPAMAFLISSPLLDGIVLGVLVFLIGVKLTAVYAALTFFASMGIGALLARLGLERDVKAWGPPDQVGLDAETGPPPSTGGAERGLSGGTGVAMLLVFAWRRATHRAREAWSAAWSAFVPLVPHLLLGTAIGAVLRGFLPVDWIVAAVGSDQPFAIPLMAALGLPVYINAEILVPITAALLDKGMGTGAVMALVIAGLGFSASEVALLAGFFRPRLIAVLMLSLFAIAAGGGLLATFMGA